MPFHYSTMEVQEELAKVSGRPIVPVVSPPLAVRVNGQDARGTLTSVGLTPEVSWSPPALGAPTSYDVHIFRVSPTDTGATQQQHVLSLVTKQSPAVIPPGILQPGSAYYVQVKARLTPGQDVERAPNRATTAKASANTVTSVFSP